MAAQGSDRLPAVLKPFLDFVRVRDRALGGTGDRAQGALELLCQKGEKASKGFDPKVLAFHLNLFRFQLNAARAPGPVLGPLRYGDEKTERFEQRDLHRIASRARKLRGDVRRLKLTNLIFEAYIAGRIPPGDLLAPEFTEKGKYVDAVAALGTLIGLPALARWSKKTLLHGTDHTLWHLCRYTKQKIGGPNARLLVAILAPLKISHAESDRALITWLNRKRVGEKVTKKIKKQ